MHGELVKTSFIVLRKTPYQETSLVVAGVGPDCGRVDFLVKAARSLGRRKFPLFELFRELSVQFRDSGRAGLSIPKAVEPLADHDSIALNPDAYLAACDCAAFLLRHSRPMLPAPAAYEALRVALLRFQEGRVDFKNAAALFKLAFIHEAGFVPERAEDGEEGERLLAELLESAVGEREPPALSSAYWSRLRAWVDGLAIYHGLG
jgi:recombinational DNA repair protein (RecF pathway)